MEEKKILLAHGSGGTMMHELIKTHLVKKFNNPILEELLDSARLGYKEKLAFTTDSFVVNPIIFPGGDIGKLSVCGTVNDLVMVGAMPEYLSLGIIVEEGLGYGIFGKIIESIAFTAGAAGVEIVTGDFKVVEKGACDKIFINTAGIGRIVKEKLSPRNISSGDKVIVTGEIGQHGFSVLSKRKELDLGFNIKSDCSVLNGLIIPVLKKTKAIKFMRDPTRGGVATTLNEIAQAAGLGIIINEKDIPVSGRVKAAGELLGIDPLYAACEGRAIIIAEAKNAKSTVALLRKHPLGYHSRIIGEVLRAPKGRVILNTILGTQRFVDMLASDPLPRIC